MPEDNCADLRKADLVTVWAGKPVEAEVIRMVLRQERIESIISPRASGGLIPAMAPESADVRVASGEANRAREIIREAKAYSSEQTLSTKVLFVCTHNKFRSQMAEAFLRALGGEKFEVFSAGTEPQGPGPETIKVMKEVGIDISGHTANHINEFLGKNLDYVITVCDDAKEKCPAFPGKCRRLHWSFENPSRFTGPLAEIEEKIREVRDAIRERIVRFLLLFDWI